MNILSANPTKWSNTLKQFVDKLLLSTGIHLFKVNNGNTKTVWQIKLTIKTPERRHRRPAVVFIVNFEQILLSWSFHCSFSIFHKSSQLVFDGVQKECDISENSKKELFCMTWL